MEFHSWFAGCRRRPRFEYPGSAGAGPRHWFPLGWPVTGQLCEQTPPSSQSIDGNHVSLGAFLLDRGVLWDFKGYQTAPCRAVGTGIPTGNVWNHLEGKKKHHQKDRLLGLIMGQDHIRKQNPTGRLHSILWMMLGIVTWEANWNLTNVNHSESFAIWVWETQKLCWEQSANSQDDYTANTMLQGRAGDWPPSLFHPASSHGPLLSAQFGG